MDVVQRPIPHIPLPHHPDFCLTAYLQNDAAQMADLLNHPDVSRYMGGSIGTSPEVTQGYIDAAKKDTSAFAYPAIRRVDDLESPSPALLGVILIRRDPILRPFGPLAPALLEVENKKSDREALHAMLCYIHPTLFGKGITSEAINHILSTWWAPRQSYAGQLHSYYFPANVPSAKLHTRCNFKVVAKSTDWVDMKPGDPPLVCTLWQGGGEARYEGSMYEGRVERWDGST